MPDTLRGYDSAQVSFLRHARPLGLVAAVALAAVVAAVGADRAGLAPAYGPSIAAAAVLAAAFAWRPIDGLLAFGLIALLADTIEHWTGMSLRVFDELAIPLFGLTAVAVHRSRLIVGRPGIREAGLALMVVAGVASSLASAVPLAVWGVALVLLLKSFALFYLILALPVRSADLRRAGLVVGGAAAVIVAIGLVEFVAPDAVRGILGLPPFEQERGGLTVVKSLFLHPALYGWLAAFVGLFAYARFAVLRERWALVLGVVLTVATLLSGRRTPLLGIGIGLVVGTVRLAASGWLTRRTWVPVALLLGVLVIASLPVLARFYTATIEDYLPSRELVEEIFSAEPDPLVLRYMQPRVGLTLGSVAVARDHVPLGAGLGRFGSHMSRDVYSPVYAAYGMDEMYGIKPSQPIAVTDTFWPMILGETGVLGLAGALVFFALLGTQLWRAVERATDPGVRAFAVGALLIYAEGLVRTLTSPALVAPPIAFFIFGAVALSLAATRREGAGDG